MGQDIIMLTSTLFVISGDVSTINLII